MVKLRHACACALLTGVLASWSGGSHSMGRWHGGESDHEGGELDYGHDSHDGEWWREGKEFGNHDWEDHRDSGISNATVGKTSTDCLSFIDTTRSRTRTTTTSRMNTTSTTNMTSTMSSSRTQTKTSVTLTKDLESSTTEEKEEPTKTTIEKSSTEPETSSTTSVAVTETTSEERSTTKSMEVSKSSSSDEHTITESRKETATESAEGTTTTSEDMETWTTESRNWNTTTSKPDKTSKDESTETTSTLKESSTERTSQTTTETKSKEKTSVKSESSTMTESKESTKTGATPEPEDSSKTEQTPENTRESTEHTRTGSGSETTESRKDSTSSKLETKTASKSKDDTGTDPTNKPEKPDKITTDSEERTSTQPKDTSAMDRTRSSNDQATKSRTKSEDPSGSQESLSKIKESAERTNRPVKMSTLAVEPLLSKPIPTKHPISKSMSLDFLNPVKTKDGSPDGLIGKPISVAPADLVEFKGMNSALRELLKAINESSKESSSVDPWLSEKNPWLSEGGMNELNKTWVTETCNLTEPDPIYWFQGSFLYSRYWPQQPCRYKYCRWAFNKLYPNPLALASIKKTETRTLYTSLGEHKVTTTAEDGKPTTTVSTDWTKGLGTTVISGYPAWWGQAGNEPCCAKCHITAGTIDLRYWSPISPEPTTPVTMTEKRKGETWTYVYPSVYFAFDFIYAQDGCRTIGGQHQNKMFGFDPSEIRSVSSEVHPLPLGGYTTAFDSYPIDWAKFSEQNCSTIPGYSYDPDNPENLNPHNHDPCHPRIAVPPGLALKIDSEWGECITLLPWRGFYDPPQALQSQVELLDTPTTNPVFSSVSAWQPGSTPAPPTATPTGNGEPPDTQPGQQPAGPAETNPPAQNQPTEQPPERPGDESDPSNSSNPPSDHNNPDSPSDQNNPDSDHDGLVDLPQHPSPSNTPNSPDTHQQPPADLTSPSNFPSRPLDSDAPSPNNPAQPSPGNDAADPTPIPFPVSWIVTDHTTLGPSLDSGGHTVIAGETIAPEFPAAMVDGKPVLIQPDGALYWGNTLLGMVSTDGVEPPKATSGSGGGSGSGDGEEGSENRGGTGQTSTGEEKPENMGDWIARILSNPAGFAQDIQDGNPSEDAGAAPSASGSSSSETNTPSGGVDGSGRSHSNGGSQGGGNNSSGDGNGDSEQAASFVQESNSAPEQRVLGLGAILFGSLAVLMTL